jgi:signal transduction histidine kinase
MADGRLHLEATDDGGHGGGDSLLVLGDRERLEQCLANLVENALKYSPPGSPVAIRWDLDGPLGQVHVCDQGPGVPAADRERLLRRFQRGRQTGDIPGSGIGLAVVQSLMQAMGGSVTIGEAPGGGADFRLALPLAPAAPAAIREEQLTMPRGGPAALS